MKRQTEALKHTKSVRSSFPTISVKSCCLQNDFDNWSVFHLRHAYRCPANISLRYTKIRRLCKRGKFFNHQPIFTFLRNQLHLIEADAIEVLQYREDLYECVLPYPYSKNESLLLVKVESFGQKLLTDDLFEKLCSKLNFSGRFSCKVAIAENLDFDAKSLPFTGVQYQTVLIIIDPSISLESEHTEASLFEILYHTISRATNGLKNFYYGLFHTFMTTLLSLDEVDLKVSMKMKNCHKLSLTDFDLIETYEDIEETLGILMIRKSFTGMRLFILKFTHRATNGLSRIFINVGEAENEPMLEKHLFDGGFFNIFDLALSYGTTSDKSFLEFFKMHYSYIAAGERSSTTSRSIIEDIVSLLKRELRERVADFLQELCFKELLELMVASVKLQDVEFFMQYAGRMKALFQDAKDELSEYPGGEFSLETGIPYNEKLDSNECLVGSKVKFRNSMTRYCIEKCHIVECKLNNLTLELICSLIYGKKTSTSHDLDQKSCRRL